MQVTGAIKAALLSGLICPGVGHIALKRYRRGLILMLSALIALSVMISVSIKRALTIIDQINSGQIPAGAEAVTEFVANSASRSSGGLVNVSVIVFLVVWLIGIIDSYRIGAAQ